TVTIAPDSTVDPVIIDGSDTSRIFNISDGTSNNINVTLSYVTLQNGYSSTQGGAIYNWENLTLSNVSVLNSAAEMEGGGIYSQTGTLTISDSTIQGNTSNTASGGGLYYESNSLTITNSSFLENTSAKNGGGFYVVGAQVAVIQSTVGNNVSGKHGGGIYSDSSDFFILNSTVANNTADENGGGLVFNGGGYLRMGYVTIANNICGADSSSVNKSGGGFYQSAGTLVIYNSIIAQNYQTSVAEANLNDFYLGTAVSFTIAQIDNNVLGKYTNNSGTTISTTENRCYSGGKYGGYVLSIDTELSDNGGDTLTIYVFSDSTATNGYGVDLYYTYNSTTNTYSLSLSSGTLITTDQIGNDRYAITGNITVGAYQKNEITYYYVGTDDDVANLNNWNTNPLGGGSSPTSWTAPDQTFIFDNDTVDISVDWSVSYKDTVIVQSGSDIELVSNDVEINLDVEAGGSFTVSGGTFTAAEDTVIVNSGTFTVTGGTVSGGIDLDAATSLLVLACADASVSGLTLNSLNSSSTVSYNYDGIQTIKTAGYGNLTINGTGAKTADGVITVSGDLTNNSDFTSDYNITVTGDTTGSGNITAANIYLNGTNNYVTGDLTATGDVTFGGGTSTGTITGVTVTAEGTVTNVNATALNATDNLTIEGAVSATTVDAGAFTLTVDGGTVNTTNLTAAILNLAGSASVTTVNASLTTINSTSGSNTLKATAASVADVNYSDWIINVSGTSTLTVDRGGNDINIDGSIAPPATSFDINNMTVASGATLKFVTTGDAVLTDIVSGNLTNYEGTLWIKSDDITLDGCNFSSGDMSLVIENSGYFNIAAGSTNIFKNSITINNVRITGTSGTATLRSTTGSVSVGNVISNSSAVSLALVSDTAAVSVGSVTDIADVTLTAGTTVTVNGDIDISGALTITAGTSTAINSDITTGGNVTVDGSLALAGNITAAGDVTVTGITTISGDTSIIGNSLNINGAITETAASNLTLGATGTGTNSLAGVTISGDLGFSSGDFTLSGTINAAGLNIMAPAALDMNSHDLTLTAALTNAGELTEVNTAAVGGNVTNSGTRFTVTTLEVGGNVTNTGTMNVGTLSLTGTGTSVLSLGGTVGDFTAINVADDKDVNLTSGNIITAAFSFLGADSGSIFGLASGTTLEVTGTLNYNVGAGYYSGNYFNTAGGGLLVRTMTGSDVTYRVGNSSSATVVTLNGTSGEKIAVGVTDSVTVNGETVTGIEDTVKFTITIDRNYGGGSYTDNLTLGVNWDSTQEGSGFDPADASLFSYGGGEWTADGTVTVTTPSTNRHAISNYILTHNGTYTIANTGADMTVPPIPNNVNIYEMANAHFLPFNDQFDSNIFLAFPVGYFPYFIAGNYATAENLIPLGSAIYRQMEYRLVTDPQTNPLFGQVPPPGAVLGQAITEEASLTLTPDAPVYLVADGEYSAGEGWLPITEPASVENIEVYQAPLTEGQINEFYLDFGSREDIFAKPVSFKSDLDEMLDDLLAG
ncbi:MAG: hypothetical protein PHV59_02495, partial [Victivallales bacterium]|nr:hypothetical protein [Victivallales bacterium]